MSALRDRLLAHLRELARVRDPFMNTQGHFYAREYVREQFARWGPVRTERFSYRGRSHQNLVLDLPGRGAPLLVGAHYDTVPNSPGADDNASGVAVLLELARAFATAPLPVPVRLIAFDLEEVGLIGSRHHAERLHQRRESVRLMLSLEMLGYRDRRPGSQRYPAPGMRLLYPDRGDFIALVGNTKARRAIARMGRTFRQTVPCEWLAVPNAGKQLPDLRRSDHAPFWDRGFPAVMVTDTSFLRNPHYHQPSDTLDTLDLEFLTGVCTGTIAALHQLVA